MPRNKQTAHIIPLKGRKNAPRSTEKAADPAEVPLLFVWLEQEANERSQTLLCAAHTLGITYGYLHQLKNGQREFAHVSDGFVRACASYLHLPPIVIKLAAGRITIDDWYVEETSDEERLARAVRRMSAHPRSKELSAIDMKCLSVDVQRWLVRAFGEMVGQNFMETPDIPALLDELRVPALRVRAGCVTQSGSRTTQPALLDC